MEIWEWLSSARKKYTRKSPLSSSRPLPMSPGLPASKLLALALSKAILTRVLILWSQISRHTEKAEGSLATGMAKDWYWKTVRRSGASGNGST